MGKRPFWFPKTRKICPLIKVEFQTPRVFENPWGLEFRYVFEMWISAKNFLLTKQRRNDRIEAELVVRASGLLANGNDH